MLNIDDPAAVSDALLDAADGVGLFRTEFLYLGRSSLPDEFDQFQAYYALLRRLRGKPFIIRTLDVGGDKPLPGIRPAETNPFLGLRGLRLCLERPELFRPQVRALLRAGVNRALSVMLPMIATADELTETRQVFAACLAELRARGRCGRAAAARHHGRDTGGGHRHRPAGRRLLLHRQQRPHAVRDGGGARQRRPRGGAQRSRLIPAVLRLIKHVVAHGQANARPVSLCGDMASDPALLKRLLATGLSRLSVAPAALGRIKLAISEADADHG